MDPISTPSSSAAAARIDPALRIASVELAVADLARSVDFYGRVLGLSLSAHDDRQASLGPDRERPLLRLTELASPTGIPPRSSGLFHVALLHPTRAGLAQTVLRLAQHRWPIDGASDHGVSEALYLRDPDGLGLEIYADRPREQWVRPQGGRGVEMFTLPLDVEELLAQGPGEPPAAIAPGTTVGHVHLKVADVPRAVGFYRDMLGFEEQARIPSAGFLSAGGYHHHIGLNSWQSAGGAPAPDSAPGLRDVHFELSSAAALQAVRRSLGGRAGEAPAEPNSRASTSGEGNLKALDPDGNPLSFATAPPR